MNREKMNIVITGHVDHGKSTVVGRLMNDTDSLPYGKLKMVKETCEKNSKPFEYAFLIDALKDEQSQGITIDAARVFFKTVKRDYIIIDAPGHIEFLKNMVTGASRADAAILVIDAKEGVKENSRRHGYLLSMLGIKTIVVLVNKMDLVGYDESVYNRIVSEFRFFLAEINLNVDYFIPVSGLEGDNLKNFSKKMIWYNGKTMLEILDNFTIEKNSRQKPFRMPIQGVYKFTNYGDDRRIIVGTVLTGSVNKGDKVVFYPSGKKSIIKSFEGFNKPVLNSVSADQAVGFTLTEQIYVSRGELVVKDRENPPKITSRLRTNIFWLGKTPMILKKEYSLKIGTMKVPVKIERIIKVLDASSLKARDNVNSIECNDVAECILRLKNPVAFDEHTEIAETGRYVIVADYEISGGGIILEALPDEHSNVREKVFLRNYKWEKSKISSEQRAERYNQKSTLLIITGEKNVGKKTIAKNLEETLFAEGKFIYFLGIGNVLYGVDADIKETGNTFREEHIRRLAETAHIMLDAGIILIVTAIELTQNDLEIIKTIVKPDKIEVIWVGEKLTTDITYDLHITDISDIMLTISLIKEDLYNIGAIFKPF